MGPITPPQISKFLPPSPTSLPRTSDLEKYHSRSASSPSSQSGLQLNGVQEQERIINPLPKSKRQRINSDPEPEDQLEIQGEAKHNASSKVMIESKKEEEDVEEIDSFGPIPTLNNQASKEFRPRTKIPSTTTSSYSTTDTISIPNSIATSLTTSNINHYSEFRQSDLEETSSSTSLTSSSSIQSNSSTSTTPSSNNLGDKDIDYSTLPQSTSLFGEIGKKIVRFLSSASPFSTYGEFSSTRLFSLPSSSLESSFTREDRVNSGDEVAFALSREADDDGEYRPVKILPTGGGRVGNNNKKRKIPGLSRGTHGSSVEEDERGFDGDEEISGIEVPKSSIIHRSDFTTGLIPAGPLDSSSSLPTTAKAAFAKLRINLPHKSIVRSSMSHRRSKRQYYRQNLAISAPLSVAAPSTYSPPASYLNRPLPLPPGSKLKGSKAIKFVQKAEKEREKEKQRMRIALGGDKLKLINFWDPDGSLALNAKSLPQRRTGAEIRSGYATPPDSSDGEDEDGSLSTTKRRELPSLFPSLDNFEFSSTAPQLLQTRWELIQVQIELVRAELVQAEKKKAFQALEEERDRKKEEMDRKEEMLEAKRKSEKGYEALKKRAALCGSNTPMTTVPINDLTRKLILPNDPRHPDFIPPTNTRKPPPIKGKKKRAAHANSINPHHINNFVPSRAPITSTSHHSTSHNDSMPPPLTSWPASEEAIIAAEAAGIRVRDRNNGSFFAGEDEWLCARCDFEIFYGEELSLARMIKQRKKVLKVRKKAKERAAKATSGDIVEDES